MFNLAEAREQFKERDNIELDCIFLDSEYAVTKIVVDDNGKNDVIESIIDRFQFLTKDKNMVQYDPIVKLSESIDSIDSNMLDTGKLEKINLALEDITAINEISDFKDIENSKAYILILTNLRSDKKILFIKKNSSSTYLKSKLKLLFSEGRFEKIDKDIFSVDDKFDCVLYENEFAIFSQSHFEQIFNYKDEYTKKANVVIEKIKKLDIIDNIEDVINDSDKITVKKKLSKITDESIEWFRDKICNNKEAIKDTINKAQLDMTISDEGKIIANDTSELIHLIQDDYVRSNISENTNYVAEKKTKVQ